MPIMVIDQAKDLNTKAICLWGMGVEGEAVLIWLRQTLKINQLVSILDADISKERQHKLNAQYGNLYFAQKPQDIKTCQIVVRSPGVSPYGKDWQVLRQLFPNFQHTSSTLLWLGKNTQRNRTIGISGSKGKTTSANLLKLALTAQSITATVVGNSTNIPLINCKDEGVCIAELSSFQAVDIKEHNRPDAILLTNLLAAHLDWHDGEENYYRDKLKLCTPDAHKLTVCNATDKNTQRYLGQQKHIIWYGNEDGFHVRQSYIYQGNTRMFRFKNEHLQAAHNLINLCGICTLLKHLPNLNTFSAINTDPDWDIIFAGLESFTGINHRLQLIGTYQNLRYIDDSSATVPDATIAALAYLTQHKQQTPITLLLGGNEHQQDYHALIKYIASIPQLKVVLMPDNGKYIAALMQHNKNNTITYNADSLEQAVHWARHNTPNGGVILLSPAAPSTNKFKNYIERGNLFKRFASTG